MHVKSVLYNQRRMLLGIIRELAYMCLLSRPAKISLSRGKPVHVMHHPCLAYRALINANFMIAFVPADSYTVLHFLPLLQFFMTRTCKCTWRAMGAGQDVRESLMWKQCEKIVTREVSLFPCGNRWSIVRWEWKWLPCAYIPLHYSLKWHCLLP